MTDMKLTCCQGILNFIVFKMRSIRKLSSFNFQWTKTLYQNNLKHIAFFSHFSRAINVIISCIIKPRKRGSLYWSPKKRKTNFKSLKFYKMRCQQRRIYLYCVFSIAMKFDHEIHFSSSRQKLSLVFLQITNYICSPGQV